MTRLIVGFLSVFMAAFPVGAVDYAIDPTHTRVEYHISHMGFSMMPGRFSDVSGTIAFDPHKPEEGHVSVVINALSVSMDDEVLDQKLRGAQFFNTRKYPLIAFESTDVTKTGFNTGTITGDVTLLGVTKPVTLEVTFNKKGWNKYANAEAIGFTARGKLRRSDFGMKAYLPDIGDEVVLTIAAEATQKPLSEQSGMRVIRSGKKRVTGGVILPRKTFEKGEEDAYVTETEKTDLDVEEVTE